MKSLNLITLSLAVSGSLFAVNAYATVSHLVTESIPVRHIYAPLGFDSNDNAQVVVTGYLPNLCYKAPSTTSSVTAGHVDIKLNALRDPAIHLCTEMVVPVMEVVSIGVLDQGKYLVDANTGTPSTKQTDLLVKESSSSAVDDFVYANVESVERVDGTRKVLLKGRNPSDCYVLDEVSIISNQKDTFAFLPKLKKISDTCSKNMVPFSYPVEVPNTLSGDEFLLHVRVMSGKSVNALFDNTI